MRRYTIRYKLNARYKIINKTFQASGVEQPKRAQPAPQKEASCCRCRSGNCDDCQCARQGRLCHSCRSENCQNKRVCKPYILYVLFYITSVYGTVGSFLIPLVIYDQVLHNPPHTHTHALAVRERS